MSNQNWFDLGGSKCDENIYKENDAIMNKFSILYKKLTSFIKKIKERIKTVIIKTVKSVFMPIWILIKTDTDKIKNIYIIKNINNWKKL